MKLKYYLRGLGIGILVTTIILMVSFSKKENSISDEEIIARAAQLGMVMKEDTEEKVPATEETQDQNEGENNQPSDEAGADENGGEAPEGNIEDPDVEGTDPGNAPVDSMAGQPSDNAQAPYRLTIHSGDVCRIVCETLEENGVIENAEELRKYLFEIGYASNMGTGVYEIPYGLSKEEIAEILNAGPLE